MNLFAMDVEIASKVKDRLPKVRNFPNAGGTD